MNPDYRMQLDTGFLRIPGNPSDLERREDPLRLPRYEDAVFLLEDTEMTITIPLKKLF